MTTKKQLELKILNQKAKLAEYLEVIETQKKQLEVSINNLCYVCGDKENLTKHHVFKHLENSTTKDAKGKLVITLCRDCHDQVENVKKLMYMYRKKEITSEHLKSALNNIDKMYEVIAEHEEH